LSTALNIADKRSVSHIAPIRVLTSPLLETLSEGSALTQAAREIGILGKVAPESAEILTEEALEFVAKLHREFSATRTNLLKARQQRQRELDGGATPAFPPETASVRESNWKVADCPRDLLDRRVEITGPVEAKMMINALNSGANVFMADFEDALAPTWSNVMQGQLNLKQAVRKTLSFVSTEGKQYELNDKTATLVVRPRGWHLLEKHLLVDGQPVSASLFDFGMSFFHNAAKLLENGSGPYFYLPKLEHYLEARLWNDVFNFAQDNLKIPRGTIRATILIETMPAAFQMDEILFELKEHASGLNAGRWDYIFSMIKKFSKQKRFVLPDRAQVTMTVPFMKAYCDLLVSTCHKRGAHAMGGMAAFIPSRKDPNVNETALAAVTKDKQREGQAGFDGTWVAHPDLVPVAREAFDKVLGENPHQKQVRPEVSVQPADLLNTRIEGASITEAGARNNISVALQYIESWLRGTGAAAINNLMEDAATAEISRSQLWQWITTQSKLSDGREMDVLLYARLKNAEMLELTKNHSGRFAEAAEILDYLVLNKEFIDFLTIPAYDHLLD
jgi:malate synthase